MQNTQEQELLQLIESGATKVLLQQVKNFIYSIEEDGPTKAKKAQELLDKLPQQSGYEASRWFLIETIVINQVAQDEDGNTSLDIKRAQKAEEFLQNYSALELDRVKIEDRSSYITGKEWLLRQIICNTPEGIERASKAEELLYNKELKLGNVGENFRDERAFLIEEILSLTPADKKAKKALELLEAHEKIGSDFEIGPSAMKHWLLNGILIGDQSYIKKSSPEDAVFICETLLRKSKEFGLEPYHVEICVQTIKYDHTLEGEARVQKLKELLDAKLDTPVSSFNEQLLEFIIDETPEDQRLSVARDLSEQYKDLGLGDKIMEYAATKVLETPEQIMEYAATKVLEKQELLIRSKVEEVLVGMKYSADQIRDVVTSDEFIKEIKKFSKLLDKQGYSEDDKKKYIEGGFKDSPLYKTFKDLIKMILNMFLNKENRYVYGSEYEIKSFSERVVKGIEPQVQQVL